MWAVLLSPAGCMWLCLSGERFWSSLYLVIKESLWQKPNIRRNELWTKELWQFQVMWVLCPSFAKWKINTFSGVYIFSVHRASTLMEWAVGVCGLEWGESPVHLSELYHHIFQASGEYFWVDVIALHDSGYAFFPRHPFSHLHTQSSPSQLASSQWKDEDKGFEEKMH